jgi:hypothetical protein
LWAAQTRQAWQCSEEAWATLPVATRALRIVALKLPDWMGALDLHKQEVEAGNG